MNTAPLYMHGAADGHGQHHCGICRAFLPPEHFKSDAHSLGAHRKAYRRLRRMAFWMSRGAAPEASNIVVALGLGDDV